MVDSVSLLSNVMVHRLMGGAMKDYRLYLLDHFSGHIEEVRELDAPDDQSAIDQAASVADHRAMELWHRNHKLKHWDERFFFPEKA
jgi:hypothetical protein